MSLLKKSTVFRNSLKDGFVPVFCSLIPFPWFKKKIPLTETLSDRCGFWLGKNLREREEIRIFFKKEVYNTRSRIVHEGKTILKGQDNESLNKLGTMTKLIIKDAMMTY